MDHTPRIGRNASGGVQRGAVCRRGRGGAGGQRSWWRGDKQRLRNLNRDRKWRGRNWYLLRRGQSRVLHLYREIIGRRVCNPRRLVDWYACDLARARIQRESGRQSAHGDPRERGCAAVGRDLAAVSRAQRANGQRCQRHGKGRSRRDGYDEVLRKLGRAAAVRHLDRKLRFAGSARRP